MAKILVIDDDPPYQELLKSALEESGYLVTVAGNGEEGLVAYQAEASDIVITDLVMPEKEGLATIRELMALDPSVKIIVISGMSVIRGVDYLPIAKRFGAKALFQKPIVIADLLKTVKDLLDED